MHAFDAAAWRDPDGVVGSPAMTDRHVGGMASGGILKVEMYYHDSNELFRALAVSSNVPWRFDRASMHWFTVYSPAHYLPCSRLSKAQCDRQ